MNIHVFDRNAELHAIQVTATLYIVTEPVCGPFLTASKSIQLMLKTIRFAALRREQANKRGKPITGQNPTMWHVCHKQNKCFVLHHASSSVGKACAVYLM